MLSAIGWRGPVSAERNAGATTRDSELSVCGGQLTPGTQTVGVGGPPGRPGVHVGQGKGAKP